MGERILLVIVVYYRLTEVIHRSILLAVKDPAKISRILKYGRGIKPATLSFAFAGRGMTCGEGNDAGCSTLGNKTEGRLPRGRALDSPVGVGTWIPDPRPGK